jgi:microcephalin
VHAAVHHLGGMLQDDVDTDTTHVVSNGRRTLKLLSGIERGCWVISCEWVMKSIESGSWIDASPFELAQQFPASRIMRSQRSSAIVAKRSLFESRTKLCVDSSTKAPASLLCRLVNSFGGSVRISNTCDCAFCVLLVVD